MSGSPIPPVRVVSGVDQHQALRARMRGAAQSMRPAVQEVLRVVIGFWPLWAVGLFGFGVIWAFALGASP
jgi:nitrate reductase NapE component